MGLGRNRWEAMVREIRIYFEGDPVLQPAFGDFLRDIRDRARAKKIRWTIIASGTRSRAFLDFQDALIDHPDAFNILLVDAEEAVLQNHTPWEHLHHRQQDRWWQTPTIDASHCHLMVPMMEAWFLADLPLLKDYYKQGFNEKVIPKISDVEKIGKKKIETSLKEATKNTTKGPYHKTRHAPHILKQLSVEKVRKAAGHCERLFRRLTEVIDPTPPTAIDESPQSTGPNPT